MHHGTLRGESPGFAEPGSLPPSARFARDPEHASNSRSIATSEVPISTGSNPELVFTVASMTKVADVPEGEMVPLNDSSPGTHPDHGITPTSLSPTFLKVNTFS